MKTLSKLTSKESFAILHEIENKESAHRTKKTFLNGDKKKIKNEWKLLRTLYQSLV